MMARLKESRWVYILLSVLLAIIFWFYVRASVDPNGVTSIHNVQVETTGTSVLTSQGLTISDISPQVVELHVEGANSVRTDLLRKRGELSVVVDVSRCVEGENTLKYRPSWPENFNSEEVFLQNQEPSTITVTVEKLFAKPFDVQFHLEGRVAKGYQMGTPAVEPEQVSALEPEAVPEPAEPAALPAVEEPGEKSAPVISEEPVVPVPAPEPERTLRRRLMVYLNGAALILPGKADGSPYYLMDLLDRSGIDFETLDGPVELLVNDGEAAFTQELRDNDRIIIRRV